MSTKWCGKRPCISEVANVNKLLYLLQLNFSIKETTGKVKFFYSPPYLFLSLILQKKKGCYNFDVYYFSPCLCTLTHTWVHKIVLCCFLIQIFLKHRHIFATMICSHLGIYQCWHILTISCARLRDNDWDIVSVPMVTSLSSLCNIYTLLYVKYLVDNHWVN